jgi:hypothetical protein
MGSEGCNINGSSEVISGVLEQFNGREEAVAFWLLLALIAALFKKDIRRALLRCVKAFLAPKLLAIFIFAALYVAAVVVCLAKVGLWNPSLVKDTAVWFVGTAFVLMLNANNGEEHFFRNLIIDNLKLAALLEFVGNLYTFNFWVELPLTLTIFCSAMISAVASTKPEQAPAKRLTDGVLALIGWVMLAFVIYKSISNFSDVAVRDTARSFALPLIMTLAFIPFTYALAVLMAYDVIFFRVNFALRENGVLARFARQRFFRLCFVSLGRVRRVASSDQFDPWNLKNKEDVLDMIVRLERKEFQGSRHPHYGM